MKISKLFHWLYAFVMFLPLFAIGVNCGYAMFNENAYKSYSGADENRELIEIDSELEINKTYYFDTDSNTSNQTYDQIFVYKNSQLYDGPTLFIDEDNLATFRLYYTTTTYIIFTDKQGNIFYKSYSSNSTHYQFEFSVASNQTINPIYNNYIKEIATNVDNRIDNVFYYSVDKVTESPLFSWAYNSFLVAPFSYIVALFGIPTNHVVVELLSYWLAISIVWLVFDLIMYVPLLVHRWLDKGVLE